MLETNFQRRGAGNNRDLGVIGTPKGSLSPKGTIKKKKQDRKIKERQAQEICHLNVQIGRLEDRDTQQQAFASLLQSLPELDPSLVRKVYTLIEKNKRPTRSSTRRMLVLLIAALCRCHPVQTAKLLPRILSYTCLRLRDRHTKTTDACVILMSAVAMYIVPCPNVLLPGYQNSQRQRDDGSTQQVFETVAAILTKEANAVEEASTRCLCGLLNPVDFDGVSVPGPSTLLSHATRIRPFFKTLLAETVAKMDGSTMFGSFAPLFLLLQSACQLARDANAKASFTQLGDDFACYIASIYEAIEDSFQCGPRDAWMVRKRGLELLTMLLDVFALQESVWCTTVQDSREYFQVHLERVRTLVLAGRHDSVSLVREAAIPAALAFEHLEKLCPHYEPRSNNNANYDFVPPNPPGYSIAGKHWAKPENDIQTSMEEENSSSFGDLMTGDEALPSHDVLKDAGPKLNVINQDDEKVMDLLMDQEGNGDQADHPQSEDELSPSVNLREPSRETIAQNISVKSSSGARVDSQTKAVEAVANLKQFAAQQRAQLRSRRSQHQNIPKISLPKKRSVQVIESNSNQQNNQDVNGMESRNTDKDDQSGELELTRAQAALEAAQCGEYELAFRLCIVEDDLELLRRTMTIIQTPCLVTLSSAVHNALFTAFLGLLDGDEGEDDSDVWLALQWLQQWAADIRGDRRQFDQLDPRVTHALHTKLSEMAIASSKEALAAAHVLFLLGI